MAFLASATNSFRDQDIRRALAPLATMSQRTRAAVLVVRHLNKNSEGNALYRGGGSIGIIGAARSGLLVGRDPDDETGKSRILASTKNNLGPTTTSLCYSIQPHGMSIKVSWSGESAHHAAALLAVPGGEEGRTTIDEACEFLRACPQRMRFEKATPRDSPTEPSSGQKPSLASKPRDRGLVLVVPGYGSFHRRVPTMASFVRRMPILKSWHPSSKILIQDQLNQPVHRRVPSLGIWQCSSRAMATFAARQARTLWRYDGNERP